MNQCAVEAWITRLLKNHKFPKQKGSYGLSNGNLVTTVHEPLVIIGRNAEVSIPAQTEVCVFSPLDGRRSTTVASIFLADKVVNVAPGGHLKERAFGYFAEV